MYKKLLWNDILRVSLSSSGILLQNSDYQSYDLQPTKKCYTRACK